MRDDPTAQALAALRRELHTIHAWLGEAATVEPDRAVAAVLSGLQVDIDAVRQRSPASTTETPSATTSSPHPSMSPRTEALRDRDRPDPRPATS